MIKISLIIFVFLALLISLFPPFEFGHMINTVDDRITYAGVVDILPVKKYDFILNSNKKKIALGTITFKKFYNKDSLAYYKGRFGDKKFTLIKSSVDSFFTYKKHLEYDPAPSNRSGLDFTGDEIVEGIINNFDTSTLDAVNYQEVKIDFEKSPHEWAHSWVRNYDSTSKYQYYWFIQPVYYPLERHLLWSELLIEYILAVFVSLISGYLIKRFIPKKIVKN